MSRVLNLELWSDGTPIVYYFLGCSRFVIISCPYEDGAVCLPHVSLSIATSTFTSFLYISIANIINFTFHLVMFSWLTSRMVGRDCEGHGRSRKNAPLLAFHSFLLHFVFHRIFLS